MDFLALMKTAMGRRILVNALRDVDTPEEVMTLLTTVGPLLPAEVRTALADPVAAPYVVAIVLAVLTKLAASKDGASDVEALINLFAPKPKK